MTTFILFLSISFIATLIVIPWLVISIPADYFNSEETRLPYTNIQNPMIKIFIILLKNLLGTVILILGIAMLVLPGQGLLTILIGLILLDFPKKYQCERWLITREPIWKSVNWLRKKSHKEVLRL